MSDEGGTGDDHAAPDKAGKKAWPNPTRAGQEGQVEKGDVAVKYGPAQQSE